MTSLKIRSTLRRDPKGYGALRLRLFHNQTRATCTKVRSHRSNYHAQIDVASELSLEVVWLLPQCAYLIRVLLPTGNTRMLTSLQVYYASMACMGLLGFYTTLVVARKTQRNVAGPQHSHVFLLNKNVILLNET